MTYKSVPFLKLSPVRLEVKDAIAHVLESGIMMNGPFLERFKSEFSDYLQLDHVVPTANCTDALEIVLRSLEVQEGDEIITTAFSWFSDASVIRLVRVKPVFCDIHVDHFGIQISDLKNKINSQTKALILPHLFGLVHPDLKEIVSICKKNNIVLIEDCAQAHGATLEGELAGTFGECSVFSFYPTKNLGALGDAGSIATNNEVLAQKCQLWSNHGQVSRNTHLQLGRNSRMDEIQAAVLTAKLPLLDADNQKRRKLAELYFEILEDTNCILPPKVAGHVYHQFVIRTDRRDELQKFLLEKGVETDVHYPVALTDMDVFHSEAKYPNASLASKTELSLPIHPNHSEDDIQFVGESIKAFFRG